MSLSADIRRTARTQVSLRQNLGTKWHSFSTGPAQIWIKGFAFCGDAWLDAEHLGVVVAEMTTGASANEVPTRISQLLSALNGNFAIIAKTDGGLFAAVDRLRSVPLFYGQREGRLCVSDDAFWVKDQVGDVVPDPLGVKEFMLTGYVTSSGTLFPNVKQLQAGEYLLWVAGESRPYLSTTRYYRWIHSDYDHGPEEELYSKMDCMHTRVFERLLAATKGRTIVVPLSGGLDSRLIATMLKRLGRDDVICFSYGRSGNRESEVSRHVAKTLGYPWVFVPYDRKSWRSWYRSPEWAAYSKYACGLCSVPHIQDWPAVWALHQQEQVPEDAIFVPGHTGDFISGGHIPHFAQVESVHSALVRAIWDKHYSLHRWDRTSFGRQFEEKNLSSIYDLLSSTPEHLASAYECWEWQERQSKFIVNSLRVYEFWGYDWRLPLWDNEMMAYWSRVPLYLRIRKRLYDQYVAQTCEAVGLQGVAAAEIPDSGLHHHLAAIAKTALGRTSLWPTIKAAYRGVRSYRRFWTHPMSWYGIITLGDYVARALNPDVRDARYSINSILVRNELERYGIDPTVWERSVA